KQAARATISMKRFKPLKNRSVSFCRPTPNRRAFMRYSSITSGLNSRLIFGICFIAPRLFGCSKTPAVKGKVLHIPIKDNVRTSDPASADDIYSAEIVEQIYEAPLQYNYYKDGYEVIPNLTEGMPQISSDEKTYTLRFKKGILFQDDPCFKATGGKGR